MALALLKPFVAERDVELFDFVADFIEVLNGERLIEAGEFVDFFGNEIIKLTAVVIFGLLLVAVESLLTLLTAHFLLTCALGFLALLGCVGVAGLLYLVGDRIFFGRVNGISIPVNSERIWSNNLVIGERRSFMAFRVRFDLSM